MEKTRQEELEVSAELKKMRVERYNLLQKLNNLYNEKRKTSVTIEENKKQIVLFTKERKEAGEKAVKARAECRKEEERLKSVRRQIDKKLAWVESEDKRIASDKDNLSKGNAKLNAGNANLKGAKKVFEQQKTETIQKKTSLEKATEEAKKSDDKHEKVIVLYEKKIKDLDEQKNILESEITKKRELNVVLSAKIKKADDRQILLEQDIKANAIKARDAEVLKKQYRNEILVLKQKQKEADDAKISYEKATEGLDDRQRVVRIQELRIQKLIRDKKLQKELEELESQAK